MPLITLTKEAYDTIQAVLEDQLELLQGLSLDEPEEIVENIESVIQIKEALSQFTKD